MKIKKNDIVKIIQGKDNGKRGKILKAMPKENKVVVEGHNLLIKHTRPRKQGEKGQRIQFPSPLDVSKVMLVCPHCDKMTRVSYKIINPNDADKKKIRFCRKCDQAID
ncbi:MAG: 50S ribosomal protein L24 [Patescibacteria group bacterium]